MNHHRRPLIALLSSLVSQIVLYLFLLFPPCPFSITHPNPHPNDAVLPLFHHFLSSSVATAVSFLPRKRKQVHPRSSAADGGGKRSRLDSVFPRAAPDSFPQFFKMTASSFEWLCGLLEPLLECRDPVGSPLNLPAETRLGIGLFRLATGADYPEIAGRFRVSESDSRFCVKHLCRVLCTNYRFWVGFPSQPELDSVSTRIEALAGIPNCCGIIGCARFTFKIGENSDSIPTDSDRNQRIAAQIVVDSSSKIVSITAGFHGSKLDSQILKSSSLFSDVSKGVLLNTPKVVKADAISIPQYLIGGGEYPLLSWLILPYANPAKGSIEENFNNVHRLLHGWWGKSVASLRNWGILNGCAKIEYKNAVACMGACSILHNMLIMRDDYSSFCDQLDDNDDGADKNVFAFYDRRFGEDSGEVVRKALATMAKQ